MSPDQSELNPQGQGLASPQGESASSETQALFLNRLRTLLERRYGSAAEKLDEHERKMLDWAIYSTFCDCLELKLGPQARELLHQLSTG